MRLDAFLASMFPEYSRRMVCECLRCVSVNGVVPGKLSCDVRPSDVVEAELDDLALDVKTGRTHSNPIPLNVICEESDFLIIDKPQGVVVHHGNGHMSATIEDSLYHRMSEAEKKDMADIRYGIVHRLDKDTSGLMVIAKTRSFAQYIISQFKARRVHKRYLALARGSVFPGIGRIKTGIRRSAADRMRFETCQISDGKEAVTDYRVLRYISDKASLLSVEPKTGRTHQIRVHFESIGNPIAGDGVYGDSNDGFSLMLHAASLGFSHPEKGRLEFESETPERFFEAEKAFSGR